MVTNFYAEFVASASTEFSQANEIRMGVSARVKAGQLYLEGQNSTTLEIVQQNVDLPEEVVKLALPRWSGASAGGDWANPVSRPMFKTEALEVAKVYMAELSKQVASLA